MRTFSGRVVLITKTRPGVIFSTGRTRSENERVTGESLNGITECADDVEEGRSGFVGLRQTSVDRKSPMLRAFALKAVLSTKQRRAESGVDYD